MLRSTISGSGLQVGDEAGLQVGDEGAMSIFCRSLHLSLCVSAYAYDPF